MAAKSKMASKTYVFLFLRRISKSFSAFEAYFLHLTFVEDFFSGKQNGGLVQDGDIFGKKSIFFSGFGHRKLSFFFNL
jgi:hypothetical protein